MTRARFSHSLLFISLTLSMNGAFAEYIQPSDNPGMHHFDANHSPIHHYKLLTATGKLVTVNPVGVYLGTLSKYRVNGQVVYTTDLSYDNFNADTFSRHVIYHAASVDDIVQSDSMNNNLVSFLPPEEKDKDGKVKEMNVVNLAGVKQARTVVQQDGEIILTANSEEEVANVRAQFSSPSHHMTVPRADMYSMTHILIDVTDQPFNSQIANGLAQLITNQQNTAFIDLDGCKLVNASTADLNEAMFVGSPIKLGKSRSHA